MSQIPLKEDPREKPFRPPMTGHFKTLAHYGTAISVTKSNDAAIIIWYVDSNGVVTGVEVPWPEPDQSMRRGEVEVRPIIVVRPPASPQSR